MKFVLVWAASRHAIVPMERVMLELNATILAEEASISPFEVFAALLEGLVMRCNVVSQIFTDDPLLVREITSGGGSGIG